LVPVCGAEPAAHADFQKGFGFVTFRAHASIGPEEDFDPTGTMSTNYFETNPIVTSKVTVRQTSRIRSQRRKRRDAGFTYIVEPLKKNRYRLKVGADSGMHFDENSKCN
jgi:hypothetical protein